MHQYRVEVTVTGPRLNEAGFMVNIEILSEEMDKIVSYFQNHLLNEKVEFKKLNPSLENFARVIYDKISEVISFSNIESINVKMWEDNIAWAEYSKSISKN